MTLPGVPVLHGWEEERGRGWRLSLFTVNGPALTQLWRQGAAVLQLMKKAVGDVCFPP